MKQQKQTIKKVKIDEHIKKASTTGSKTPTTGKRGRPRKIREGSNGRPEFAPNSGTDQPLRLDHQESLNQDANIDSVQQAIEPVYDTTEEAKGFLRAPFDIAAGLTGIKALSLYPTQLDALAPSFKVVYDKRIAPYMGENADLIAFTMVFMGVAFEKVQVYREETAKLKPEIKPQATDEAGKPFIPTEHHV